MKRRFGHAREFGGAASLAGLIAIREAQRFRGRLAGGLHAVNMLRTPSPSRLVIAPQDIRTADPTIASDIYAGHLVFKGSFVNAHGQSPFDVVPPSDAWAEGLHEFGWLRHLRAADTSLSRANARALLEDWITASHRGATGPAWRPAVVARRLLSWVAQSPLVLSSSDNAFYRRFMRSIGRQTAFLQRALASGLEGEDRLFAAIALTEVGLCTEGLTAARKQGMRVLVEELTIQILPDGGHISRNPSVLLDILLDLLPLRQAFASRSAQVPPVLLNAMDRIMPMVRLFRYGDGSLGLFNGMGVTPPDVLATLLSYDDTRGRPLGSAPYSGYQRLDAGGVVVVCDVAKPPPRAFSTRAHAGTLSFEMTIRSHRLVVNCGHPPGRNRRASEAARSTAAHSTLVVGDSSSSRFATGGLRRWLKDQVIAGPTLVETTRADDPDGTSVVASHNGYLDRFGLVHRRRLLLRRDGDLLDGEDSLSATNGASAQQPFVIRFHLHPAIRAEASDGNGIKLRLPDDECWIFSTDETKPELEESIFFASAEGPRRTLQIAVAGTFPTQSLVKWSFARVKALPH